MEEPNNVPPVAALHHLTTPLLVVAFKFVYPAQVMTEGDNVTFVGLAGGLTITVTDDLVALIHETT